MCDEWMPTFRVKMPLDDYERLPRNGAYKYEYADGETILSPSPRMMHATLDLTTRQFRDEELAPADEYTIAPATRDDHDDLAALFAVAFYQTQPFACLRPFERSAAAHECLRRTFEGEDGPWRPDASFLARSTDDGKIAGALLVTMVRDGDPSEHGTYLWPDGSSPTATTGQPHITWTFTHPFQKGNGIGTRLLAATCEVLKAAGYRRLLTTFLAGNDSSMLWHWRNGFELAARYASSRRLRSASPRPSGERGRGWADEKD